MPKLQISFKNIFSWGEFSRNKEETGNIQFNLGSRQVEKPSNLPGFGGK